MPSIEEFIENTNKASSNEEVSLLFEDSLKALGFDRFVYSLITDHPSLGLKAGHGLMRNYPEDWMSYYMAKGYDKIDPIVEYCFHTTDPYTWDKVMKTVTLSEDQKILMQEAKEAKLLDGAAVPMYGLNGELSGIGVANSDGGGDLSYDNLCKIRLLAFQFHLAYTARQREEERMRQVSLTSREREILLWAAEGKSDPVIAEIIGISYPTVRYHMNNIFRKLEANERTLAVVKAIRYGLILPSYVSERDTPIRLVR